MTTTREPDVPAIYRIRSILAVFGWALALLTAFMLALALAFHAGRVQGTNDVLCTPSWDEPVRRDA